MKDWEILADWPDLNAKATRMLQALIEEGPRAAVNPSYRGDRPNLMLYGPGAPARLPIVKRHLKAGGHVAMWDLGYWDRSDSMRLSIDTLHPQAKHLAMAPSKGRREFELREDADPNGPILLIGLGPKSVWAYDLGAVQQWERKKVEDLRRRYPGRRILWRPKGDRALPLLDLRMRHGMPIDEALKGCSLLVCRHSNAAVDACIAGVPVECEDGAAAALYAGNPSPTREQRAEFLGRLTHFNWSRLEAAAAWAWINELVTA